MKDSSSFEQVELWRAICENATVSLFIMDSRQECVYMNPAAEELTGYSLAEVQGRALHDVIHHTKPDGSHYPLEDCPIDRAFPQNLQEQGEEIFVHKDGSFYPVAFTASPLRNDQDQITGTIIEVRPLAKLQALEQQRRTSDARLSTLLNLASDIIWLTSMDGDLEGDLTSWRAFTGQPDEEARGAGWANMLHPDDREHVLAAWARTTRDAGDWNIDYRLRRADGEWRWTTARATPLRDEKTGEALGYIGMNTDITDAKEAEERIRESEARFRMIADHAPVMIWMTDPDGACTYLSRPWYEFTGQTQDEGLGLGWLEMTHPDDKAETERVFLAANEKGEPFSIDYRLKRADGAWRWVADSGRPRITPDGKFLGYVGTLTNIDERKENAARLEYLLNELNHRVKNTLMTVQSVANLTLDPGEGRERFVARMHALSRVHNLLSEQNWTGADLKSLIEQALAPFVDDRRRFSLSGPPRKLAAKRAQNFAMAFHELATNAAKYGALSNHQGHIDVQWSCDDDAESPQSRLVWTETNGPPAAEPERRGFGTMMLRDMLSAEINGVVTINYPSSGLICLIEGEF